MITRKTILALLLAGPLMGLARAETSPPRFVLPLACRIGGGCEIQHYVDHEPGARALDYRCQARSNQDLTLTNFRVADREMGKGVDVLAAASGTVLRLRDGVADAANTDPDAPSIKGIGCGNAVVIDHGGGWTTIYCHLAQGSVRVAQGESVEAGQAIGRVGLSGYTEFAHLGFGVRKDDHVVDPFAPDSSKPRCAPQPTMWAPDVARTLTYKTAAILNAGVSGGRVGRDEIEAGGLPPISPTAPEIVAYGRVMNVERGDRVELFLVGPDDEILANYVAQAEAFKAQVWAMAGHRRPRAGWPAGEYQVRVRVLRGGKVVAEQRGQSVLSAPPSTTAQVSS